MDKNKKLVVGMILVIVVILGGNIIYKKSITRQQIKEPIKIGGIFALTGLGASQGEQELKGVQIAVKEINEKGGINGRLIKFISEDVSLDKLNTAGSAARKLIDIDKVVAIIGTTWDEPAQAILPIIEESKVPMVGQNQTRTLEEKTNFNYFFSTWHNNEIGVLKLLAYAQKNKLNKIAIIRPIGAGFYEYIKDTVKKNANKFGLEIIDDINLNNPTVSDFRTDLAKIKMKKPDAVLIVLNGFTDCPFLKQMNELGMNIPVLSTEGSGDYVALKNCPKSMENLYFSYPRTTANYQQFADKYFKDYISYPETPSIMTAYDAFNVIITALKETNGEGGDKLRKIISETKDYKGVSLNNISFDEVGFVITPSNTFEMKTIRDGKFITIE